MGPTTAYTYHEPASSVSFTLSYTRYYLVLTFRPSANEQKPKRKESSVESSEYSAIAPRHRNLAKSRNNSLKPSNKTATH
jgi:hypothetical protein